jgi:hypothetical protein
MSTDYELSSPVSEEEFFSGLESVGIFKGKGMFDTNEFGYKGQSVFHGPGREIEDLGGLVDGAEPRERLWRPMGASNTYLGDSGSRRVGRSPLHQSLTTLS